MLFYTCLLISFINLELFSEHIHANERSVRRIKKREYGSEDESLLAIDVINFMQKPDELEDLEPINYETSLKEYTPEVVPLSPKSGHDEILDKSRELLKYLGCETPSDLSLLEYLRVRCELRGTKYMCREGGCGSCIVAAARPGETPHAVNSCLVSVASCQNWEITTIEDIGNRLKGYHPLQKTLAKNNGTQCGYCSPGWVMAMYSLLQSKTNLTMLEIEKSFGSNICRCTGYRPILEAFKKFAVDAPKQNKILDIEDLSICNKTGKSCNKSKCLSDEWCFVTLNDVVKPHTIKIELKDGRFWYKVYEINDIFQILRVEGDDDYMFVAGNTAKGVYPISEYPKVLIDVSSVEELKGYSMDQNLIIGAGSTLSETKQIFEKVMRAEGYFEYLETFIKHLDLVAHIPVRNIGTLAGNLMIKHEHTEFQSDIFVILETVGAVLTIVDSSTKVRVNLSTFLKMNMKGKLIKEVLFPPLCNEYHVITYKIMPRSQNAHAIVNAGFRYRLSNTDGTVREATLVYGGLSSNFVHASATEKYLTGKKLFTNETLQNAIQVLVQELVVTENPPEPSVKYREALAVSLFYKSVLFFCPANILLPTLRSGREVLGESRGVSNGRQLYDTNPALWPLNQPLEKVEALIQCAGETMYSEDLPAFPREVFGAFVMSTVPLGNIVSIDASPALKYPGVVAFYSAKDIPGVNSSVPGDLPFNTTNEELFCNGKVKYYNQVIGVIVAETRHIAESAAKLVNIKYDKIETPVVDIKVAKTDENRVNMFYNVDATDKGADVFKVVKGGDTIYGQYNMCIETLVCVARPNEEGLEVHASTQWMNGVQVAICRALKLPENKVDVHVRRLGGAFGFKITRASQVAVACALVAAKLNRPCRILLPLATNTRAMGKRLPCSTSYEAGVDKSGKIQYMNHYLYSDNGYIVNENLASIGNGTFNNCYDKSRWNYKAYNVTTDTASNSWFRSPGTFETVATAEYAMERIACELSLDPLAVRLVNLASDYNDIKDMIDNLKTNALYEERKSAVDKFNSENRWKKRGLRFSLLRWQSSGAQYLDVNMSVYLDDGTVAITHGGIEMGQGINTKAVQVCAYLLKIPIEKVQIKANSTINAPNGFISGGSQTSINVATGVRKCCEQLLERLEPIRAKMNNPTWEQLVRQAFQDDVDLQVHDYINATAPQSPPVFGVTLAEVEIDVLTGEWQLLRVDLVEDAGLSVSPEIDIGQVEGAFIMGLGCWTSERLVYSKQGELLTDRTWNYWVPLARDIPQDFRVYFRKNSYSDKRIFGAKSIGEPPICMAVAVAFALRAAICAARCDAGAPASQWFQIDGPYTTEAIQLATLTNFKEFKLY